MSELNNNVENSNQETGVPAVQKKVLDKKMLITIASIAAVLVIGVVVLIIALGGNSGAGTETPSDEPTSTTYTVTLVDGDKPIKNAMIAFVSADGQTKNALTDANGVATYTAESGTWQAKIALLKGYEYEEGKLYDFVDGKVTIALSKAGANTVTYTVYVKDASGNSVEDISVQVCDTDNTCLAPKTSDEDGKVTFEVDPSKTWKATLFGEENYVYFVNGEATIIITTNP